MPDPQDFSRAPERPVFEALERLGIKYRNHEHVPVRTVAESSLMKTDMPGAHTKNLFMKDKKGALVLVSALHSTVLPLNQLHRALGCQRLSFTDAQLLWDGLSATPGSVTGFAVMNDAARRVRYVLDDRLWAHDVWNFHPMRNDMTTAVAREDFLKFLEAVRHPPVRVDFSALAPTGGKN